MQKYLVKYKLKDSLFWKVIKNVIGDFSIETPALHRVFLLEDHSRIEIPYNGTSFYFSKERFYVIKENIEKESGQSVKIKGN